MNNSRNDLINAIAAGNVERIAEIQQLKEDKWKNCLMFADINENDTWDVPLLGLSEINGKWVQSGKYMGITYEAFAALIVKYNFKVMAIGGYVNYEFPEHSEAYEPPDPTETPEHKYQRILNDLKEAAEAYREIRRTGKLPE